jgi:hypothetical protein
MSIPSEAYLLTAQRAEHLIEAIERDRGGQTIIRDEMRGQRILVRHAHIVSIVLPPEDGAAR